MAGGCRCLFVRAARLALLVAASPLVAVGLPGAAVRSAGGLLDTTLSVEVSTVELGFQGITFSARLYNGSFPAPVLRVAPGDRVRIRVQNRLGPNEPGCGCHAHLDQLRAPNATNLHIHGIFDDSGQDNTFVCVPPGEEYVYEYGINRRTGTSTLWYHPHLDGSSAAQLYSGMAGVFEIVDPEELDFGFAVEAPLLLHAVDFDPQSKEYIGTVLSMGGESHVPLRLHNPTNFTGRLLLTNGRVGTTLALAAGELARLKLVNAMSGAQNMLNYGFADASESKCELHILAWDGVYLHAPRRQSTVLLPPGGKTDVAVSCSEPGVHQLVALPRGVEGVGALFDTKQHPIAELIVEGVAAKPAVLPDTLPGPPPYYRDLRGAAVSERHAIMFSNEAGATVVNGLPYPGTVSHVAHRKVVQEWRLMAGEGSGLQKAHPYHQHMVHFQVIAVHAPAKISSLMAQVGDYRDTIPMYKDVNYTVRFVVPFVGPMMVHCHILKHEDMGMMTVVNFTDPASEPLERLSSRPVLPLAVLARGALAVLAVVAGLLLCGVSVARRSVRECCEGHYSRIP